MRLFDMADYLIIFLILIIFIYMGWRFSSRRWKLPCPASLIWMLEHRIMESVAGSEILIKRADVQPGMQVLDAGCGPGRVSIPLGSYLGEDGSVTALDLQESMLAKLRERIKKSGLSNIRPLRAALGEGLLLANTFDRAIMVTVLGEIPDRAAALDEIYRSLKPGGILSITEVLPDPHYQIRTKVEALGKQAGFGIEYAYRGLRAYTLNLRKPV
jgi:ubiquinone/menaquinone biosynthesis C-methylase UbiE